MKWTRASREKVRMTEALGVLPVRERLSQARKVFRGDPYTPSSHFGISSIRIFKPHIAIPTWLGLQRSDRLSPIYNLFNHTPTAPELGWSVKHTQTLDFRGKKLTYDSHNGTDFVCPPGTRTTAVAPGTVLLVQNDFHRGGLKVFIDHGAGLVTSYNHLSRSFVKPGQTLGRGEVIALSGASGLENVLCFPWVAPHIHFNTYLNGKNVDPFARIGTGEVSLWTQHNSPLPYKGGPDNETPSTPWNHPRVNAIMNSCKDPETRSRFAQLSSPEQKALFTMVQSNYFPTRFSLHDGFLTETFPRAPRMNLPLHHEDYDGIVFPDE